MAKQRFTTTLGKYLAWANSAGFDINWGMSAAGTFVRISHADGRVLFIADAEQGALLAFDTIKYYDRRLGVTSPFPRE